MFIIMLPIDRNLNYEPYLFTVFAMCYVYVRRIKYVLTFFDQNIQYINKCIC